jgi:hypothetical protein
MWSEARLVWSEARLMSLGTPDVVRGTPDVVRGTPNLNIPWGVACLSLSFLRLLKMEQRFIRLIIS